MRVSSTLVLSTIALGLLHMAPALAIPAAGSEIKMQSCGSTRFEQMTSLSSTLAIRTCSGGDVYGIGVSPDEAVKNLNGFIAVSEAGIRCTAGASSVTTGSYGIGAYATFYCNGYPTTAIGSTPTIAANRVLEIATERAASGSYCSASLQGSYYPELHGFRFSYQCRNAAGAAWNINGLGSDIDQANNAAMKVMRLTATLTTNCSFSPAILNGVIFTTNLQCKGSYFRGYGSSVTSATEDALTQAGAN